MIISWAERSSDRLNPVLVREMRQALNGKVFRAIILLMLGGCFLMTVVFTNDEDVDGAMLFFQYYWILTLIAFVIIPFSALQQFRVEIEGRTNELLMVSSLSPQQIVRGKLLCLVVQLGMFYSVMGPFMAFCNLLKGIDVVTIISLLTASFLYAIVLCAFGILCSTLSTNRARFSLFSVVLMIGLFWQYGVSLAGAFQFAESGVSSLMVDGWFWVYAGLALAQGISILIIVFQAAVVMITFQNANRSTGLRLAMTGNFILTTITFGMWFYHSGFDVDILTGWAAYSIMFWAVLGLFVSTESEKLSRRVQTEIPKRFLMKLMACLFYPGRGRGMLLLTVGVLVSLGLGFMGQELSTSYSSYSSGEKLFEILAIGLGFVWIYSLIGFVVKGLPWMKGAHRNAMSRALVLLILTAFALLPAIFQSIFYQDMIDNEAHFMNPFYMIPLMTDAYHSPSKWLTYEFMLFLSIFSGIGLLYILPSLKRGIGEIFAGASVSQPSPIDKKLEEHKSFESVSQTTSQD